MKPRLRIRADGWVHPIATRCPPEHAHTPVSVRQRDGRTFEHASAAGVIDWRDTGEAWNLTHWRFA